MKKSTVAVLVLISLLSLVLIGCSNVEQNTNAKGKETIIEQIKKRGKIIVATDALAPFDFVENGKIVGYDADILAEIVKVMGVELDHKDVPFSGIFTGLESKQFDFLAAAMSVTPERQAKYDFTVPIADNAWVIVGQKNDLALNSMDDLNGKIVGCNTGSGQEKKLVEDNEKLKAQGKEGFEIKTYPSTADSYLDLKNGRIDAVSTARPGANYNIQQQPGIYEIKFTVVDKIYMAWGVRKEDKELLEFLNTEILKLKKSGKLAELQQKWFGTTWDLPDQLPQQ